MQGITFDTGALIALERQERRMRDVYLTTAMTGSTVTVPTPVIVEWWREHGRRGEQLLRGMDLEPLTPRIAKLAGDAIKATPGATAIDAIVMASAAQRGDIVYTSDVEDLESLRAFFPSVRILHV
jgi:predicted nucleic acid-binding protein